MKSFLHPVPVACVLIAIAGAVLNNIPMVALALVCAVAGMSFLGARKARDEGPAAIEDLSSEARSRFRPLQRLVADIERIRAENASSQAVQILGAEALAEAQDLLGQVVRSLIARDHVKGLSRGRYAAEKEMSEARMRLEFAGESEKKALNATIEARTAEIGHYGQIDDSVKLIEVGLSQSEAILAEIKARLAVAATGERLADAPREGLRETIGRLQTIAATFDEAEQVIHGPI